jgi:hypothetical protein
VANGTVTAAGFKTEGNATAAYYFGDGSNLTNLPAGTPYFSRNSTTQVLTTATANDVLSLSGNGATDTLTLTNSSTGYGLNVTQSGTTSHAIYSYINHSENPQTAVYAYTNGYGQAVKGIGAGSRSGFAVMGQSHGDRISVGVYGLAVGDGTGVMGAVLGAGKAGYFQINNAMNTVAIIEGITNGTGPLISVSSGTGTVVIDNAGNANTSGTVKSGGYMVPVWDSAADSGRFAITSQAVGGNQSTGSFVFPHAFKSDVIYSDCNFYDSVTPGTSIPCSEFSLSLSTFVWQLTSNATGTVRLLVFGRD